MISGRVWKFGDYINTDYMMPGPSLALSQKEQTRWVFQANRPGWVDLVKPGDIIVGGKGYGIGSSRPAARSLRNLGIGCLLVESMNRLFFRNCVNFGMLGLECPGIVEAVDEGDTIEVSLDAWTVRNLRSGAVLDIKPVPAMLVEMMRSGGVYPFLEKGGYIAPAKPAAGEPAAAAAGD